MEKILNKFYQIIDKIGKQNFILVVFILIVIIITGLYTTFSLYTSSEGVSILDGVKTYKFILNADNTENSVTIAAGSSKNVAITVTNPETITLKYGIYYSSSDDLSDVLVGYLFSSDYPATGLIQAKSDYIVTIKVINNASSNVTINFGLSFGLENGGDLTLPDGKSWLSGIGLLSEVPVGSYVAYAGTNGCPEGHCDGTNVNYVSDTDMGYCYSSSYKFSVNGWRVGYIQNDTAYLVSAGATECMCTNTDGTTSDSSCSDSETTEGVPQHLANLDSKALTYCNSTYAYGGVCNSASAWAMDATDFKAITGSVLSSDSCYKSSYDTSCGYGNDLIDNGGYYWFATPSSSSSTYMVRWVPTGRRLNNALSNYVHGVRPVLRLASSVQVVGGTGTYEDPYQISAG